MSNQVAAGSWWTIISEAAKDANGRRRVLVECKCGKTKVVDFYSVKRGTSTNCGCVRIKHGESTVGKRSPEYESWIAMNDRCANKNRKYSKDYVGRGISICQRWRESFENFLDDMGRRPTVAHTLERIDNDGNYEPSNCRWATRSEQQQNRRVAKVLTLNGDTFCVSEWSRRTGIHRNTLDYRLQNGWSIEQALTVPVRKARVS